MDDIEKQLNDPSNPDLAPIPDQWIVEEPALPKIYASMDQGAEVQLEDEKYELRKWILFVLCTLSSMIGIVLVLMATATTVLFNEFKKNQKILIGGLVFFVPAVVWFVYVFIPCGEIVQYRKLIFKYRNIREITNRKQIAHFNGTKCRDKLDDEFEYVDKGEERMTDRFHRSVTNRGINISAHFPLPTNNGYTNDYYFRYHLLGEYFRKKMVFNSTRYIVPESPYYSCEDEMNRIDPNWIGEHGKFDNPKHVPKPVGYIKTKKLQRYLEEGKDWSDAVVREKKTSKFKMVAAKGEVKVARMLKK